jgi:hypothetical protein
MAVAALAATTVPPADAAPSPAAPPTVPAVALVGDSIGRDAKRNITTTVSQTHAVPYYRAVAAGFIGYHLDDTAFLDVVSAPSGPDIVIAELGTGDAFWDHTSSHFRAEVQRFLDTVLPRVTCIVWINQKPTPTRAYPHVNENQVAFNRILDDVLLRPQYENRVRLVDYAAWYRIAGDRFFLADLLHHTAAGRREFGLLAAQGVRGCDPAHASGPFWDVPDDHWAAEAIAWMGDNGHATGYPNGTYRANLGSFKPTVSRVQFARMLWRILGEPPATGGFQNPWPDSPPWADPALDYLKQTSVVRGISPTRFAPDRPLSRVEAAQWLWRAAGSPSPTGAAPWPDTPAYAADGLAWIFEQGVMSGFPDGRFHPDDAVTRAQAASFLFHYAPLPPAAPEAPPTTTTTVPPPTTSAPLPPSTTTSGVPASTTTTVPPTTTSSTP